MQQKRTAFELGQPHQEVVDVYIPDRRSKAVLGDLVNEIQSAFVADRQILDGPFILNEIVQWCKKRNKQAMVFKVDFEKAYDSVRWDFVEDILRKFGFGDKWCTWIRSYAGLFKGIKLGSSLQMSHLFYADDAIFMGQWNQSNIDTITRVLDVFYRASGLRINMHKSKLMGISVDADLVKQAASKIGCMVLKTPFQYLGSRVGDLRSRIQSWIEIIEGMEARLSRWKVKTLFIGGRLTLNQSEYSRAGSEWKSVMASKDAGGLGARVISALHGDAGKIGKQITSTYPSTWLTIVQEVEVLKMQGLNLLSFINPKLGNGLNTSFWDVPWRGDTALKELAPRIYALETLKDISVAAKLSHGGLVQSLRRNPRGGAEQVQLELLQDMIHGCMLSNSNDRWSWSLDGGGDFTVSSVRKAIDNHILPKGITKTRWIKEGPIKINNSSLKVTEYCFPTRFNMSRRGMEIDSILCPLCNSMAESSRHLFFSCNFIRDIMLKINRWWEVDHREFDSYDEWLEWLASIRLPMKVKKVFEGHMMSVVSGILGIGGIRRYLAMKLPQRREFLMKLWETCEMRRWWNSPSRRAIGIWKVELTFLLTCGTVSFWKLATKKGGGVGL
ncbi:RNA-directed DNA polymerase, eukaryota, reverse transcriptase zinc-binding domain protein [Tanacetum coccineum]